MGNVKYIGWSMEFYCQPSLVDDLLKLAKVMEDDLDRWNEEVAEARRQFYELNYYTIRQLLVLRTELGKMKNPGSTISLPQQAQVMALLESISNEINMANVMTVVQQVIAEGQKSLDMQKSPIPVSVQVATAEDVSSMVSISPVSQIGKSPPAVERPVKATHLQSSPLVSLSKDELNEKQKEYFTNIIEHFEYHEMTALKAIEEVGTGDWNDIENWIQENGDQYDELFQEGDSEEDDKESDESGEEDEGMSCESDQDKDIERNEPLTHIRSVKQTFALNLLCDMLLCLQI